VSYAPGELSAVGYRSGQPVATNELRTTGKPAQLQVAPLPSPISSDIAVYEITVVDDAGLLVSDATPAVTVKVEGPGRLIGLDTGDLNYVGLFKTDTRNAYQGRLLATVQRIAPTGEINVTAAAPDLLTTAAPAR
jgi:beta-galactosidase